MRKTVLVALTLWLAAPPVAAEEQASPVSAEREAELTATFAAAQEHYKAKRYAEALPLFEQVARELDSPNALLYVARCLREMGRDVEAYRAMHRTVTLAGERAASEPRFADTRAAAEVELAALEERVGRVTVSVPSAPAGTVIEVAGHPTAAAAMNVVAPGSVQVDVRAPGYAPVRREIEAAAGSAQNIIIEIVAAPAPAPPAPPPQPVTAPVPTTTRGGGVRIAGFVVLGVGAAGWAALIACGVLSDDRFAEIEARCPTPPCTTDADQEIIDEGRDFELAANIGVGVGAAGTVAGLLMVIFGGPSEEPVAPAISAAPLPGGGFVSYAGAF